ncbi:MAG: cytochrome-c peroxidase [Panacagrimonas sp.]
MRVPLLLAGVLIATLMMASRVDAIARLVPSWLSDNTPKLAVPEGWPAPRYDFSGNPITPAGFALGRKLFYDPGLSRDGSIACASCHQSFVAFAHAGHRVSHGVQGLDGTRNSPALFNLAWQPDFMHDGAVHHLEVQPLAPISNPVEMGESLPKLLDRLRRDPDYVRAFEDAFGSPGVDSQRLFRAFAQFMGTMISADSRYDRDELSEQESHGLAVFREHCAACHAEPLFTDFSYRDNGLDADPTDPGRAAISGREEDRGRFRVPSLRNVALTAPYMHDGRLRTLDEVLDHYEHGVQVSPNLDPRLRKGLRLNVQDRVALRQFLSTLTDESFVRDPRFARAAVSP